MFNIAKQNKPKLNAVEKALEILLAFQEQRTNWGVRELSGYLGLSPGTVQRILQSLKAYSFVDQDPQTRQYRLGNIYFAFLRNLQSNFSITLAAQPFMKRLLVRTQETVHLNIIEGMERVCIETLESPERLKATMPIGSRASLYSGATSKCLLAFSAQDFFEEYFKVVNLSQITRRTITDINELREELALIKQNGYATSLGELTPGLGAMSAPLLNHAGVLIASISLAMPELRYRDESHRKYCIKEIVQTATEFSESIGFRNSN